MRIGLQDILKQKWSKPISRPVKLFKSMRPMALLKPIIRVRLSKRRLMLISTLMARRPPKIMIMFKLFRPKSTKKTRS
jgi:hypothetical protein